MSKVLFPGHALIITVEQYANTAFNLDKRVTEDGVLIEKTLLDQDLCGYQRDKVTVLRNSGATRSAILSLLQKWRSFPSDVPVTLFFSGHGYRDPHSGVTGLCCHEFEKDGTGALSAEELRTEWSELNAERKLVILDACHAGGTPATKEIFEVNGDKCVLGAINADAFGTGGSVVIASSKSNQTSRMLPGDRSSLFTKHFVSGLQGAAGHDQDGYIRLFALFAHVRALVAGECPSQTPVLSAHELAEDFRLAYCSEESKRKSLPTESLAEDDTMAILQSILPTLYPHGPIQDEVWERAGGDNSTILLSGTGQSQWRQALRKLALGGGGNLSVESLIYTVLEDYPFHPRLKNIT